MTNATPKTADEKSALYNTAAPFFDSAIRRYFAGGAYDCLFCGDVMATADYFKRTDENAPYAAPIPAAITYTLSTARIVGHFAHIKCLRAIPGASLSTGSKAKRAASEAAKERVKTYKAAHPTTAQTPAPAVDVDALTARIREEIDAEYLAMAEQVATIIATLTAERDALQEQLDKKAERRSKLAA